MKDWTVYERYERKKKKTYTKKRKNFSFRSHSKSSFALHTRPWSFLLVIRFEDFDWLSHVNGRNKWIHPNLQTQAHSFIGLLFFFLLFLFISFSILFSVNFSAASTWRIHVNLNELFHIVTCLLLEVQGVCELGFMFYAFIPLSYMIFY